MPSPSTDASLRLGSGCLIATDYQGAQEGAGLFFNNDQLEVKTKQGLAPLQVASTLNVTNVTDDTYYAVTHHDLDQKRDPVAWVHMVVHDSTNGFAAAVREQLRLDNGVMVIVFFKDTGRIAAYHIEDGNVVEINQPAGTRTYPVGTALPRPLIVVHTGSGTVYRVSGTIGQGEVVVTVCGSRRYEAVAYQRSISSSPERQNEYVFRSEGTRLMAERNGVPITHVIDALPRWDKIAAEELRAIPELAELLVLVEDVGLCSIQTSGTSWADDVVIPWTVLRETRAVVEIRDVDTPNHFIKSPLSKHTLQITPNGVQLITRPACRSNTKPVTIENPIMVSIDIEDVRYDAYHGFANDARKYTIGPVEGYSDKKTIREALTTPDNEDNVIRTLLLHRDSTGSLELHDTTGEPKLRLKTYTLDALTGRLPGSITSENMTMVDLHGAAGIPQPLEYENDDQSHVVMEVAICEAVEDPSNPYGKMRIIKLLYHNNVWTLAPSYLLENAWAGRDTVSHLRVVGGRDATSTRTGDVVVAGGMGVGGTIWCQTMQTLSDATKKTGISALQNCLTKVRSMIGTSWQWRNNGRFDSGFIAQDLVRVVPNAVHTDPHDGTMSINYNSLMPYLSGAVQELADRIDNLEEADRKKQRLS